MKELEMQKKKLIEKLGACMERNYKVAPLGARILSTLIFEEQRGATFEELVRSLNAGKSSISNNLDILQTKKKVDYFTKPGDRKRYFFINPDLVIQAINETAAAWEAEKKIQQEIFKYKRSVNTQGGGYPLFNLKFQENLLEHFQEATSALIDIKESIINKRNEQTK